MAALEDNTRVVCSQQFMLKSQDGYVSERNQGC